MIEHGQIERTRGAQTAQVRHAVFARLALGTCMLFIWLLALAPRAFAGPPTHVPMSDPINGFALNHACGTAVDSEGDIYVADAGESKIEVFASSGSPIGSVEAGLENKEPCGLAVDSTGNLYVSERAVHKIVRFVPIEYPFQSAPAYGLPQTIDSSGVAEGISVDPFDSRLYVADGQHISVYNADGSFAAVDETQRIFPINATGGTYELCFKNPATTPEEDCATLAYEADAAEVQEALETFTTIGTGNVSVAQHGSEPTDHLVTFTGALADTDVEPITCNAAGLTPPSPQSIPSCFTHTEVVGFSGFLGTNLSAQYSGVAAYTYRVGSDSATRYVYAADTAGNHLALFRGPGLSQVKLRRTISGPSTGESFGFGAAGAYLAVDTGNRNAEGKCSSVAEQACTAGHLLVYDHDHEAVDEFEADGEFLDRLPSGIADGLPTGLAVDRSGGPTDGRIYVATGTRLLAFAPLVTPGRTPFPSPLSHTLPHVEAVATDSFGDLYAVAEQTIHIYSPAGNELAIGPEGKGFPDENLGLYKELAVDSSGNVYVLENGEQVTYYAPSSYPPVAGTTYVRHQPVVATRSEFPGVGRITSIAINPADDHLYVGHAESGWIIEYNSAASDSAIVNPDFVPSGVNLNIPEDIAVDGATGDVYISAHGDGVYVIDHAGSETVAHITGAGSPKGPFSPNPGSLAVDQSNGHVLVFDKERRVAEEYDTSGAFVANVGAFKAAGNATYRVAIDSSCALHDPPLTQETSPRCSEFDPSDGNAYVALDDSGSIDVSAFGRLEFGEPPIVTTGEADGIGSGNATLHGTVDPRGFELVDCRFEYQQLTEAEFTEILAGEAPPFSAEAEQSCAESTAEIGHGTEPVAVHTELGGLDPGQRYRYRLVAKNKYGEIIGKARIFGPPAVELGSAEPVLYTEAILHARIDTAGLSTKYRFEYVAREDFDENGFQAAQATPAAELGAGKEAPVAVKAPLVGLAEGTEYRFRLVAENEAAEVEAGPQGFVTLERRPEENCANAEYRTGLSAKLPDCRAYELVTPAETRGFSIFSHNADSAERGFNAWVTDPRGPGAGEAVSYATSGTLPGYNGSGGTDGYRSDRALGQHPAAGWSTSLVTPSFMQAEIAKGNGISADQRYSFWDLSQREAIERRYPPGEYLRTPELPNSNCVPAGLEGAGNFETVGCGTLGEDLTAIGKFVSPGGAHVVFESASHLEGDAPPAGTRAVYERAAGEASAEVVSMKPDGSPFGMGENSKYVAATEDGAMILFETAGALYARTAGNAPVEVAPAPQTFAGVSGDGKRIFYAASAFGEQVAQPAQLFVCDLSAGPCAGADAHPPTAIAPNSIFVNVSADGSHVFFTSEDELAVGGHAGQPNLYLWDAAGTSTSFVSPLSPVDFEHFGEGPESKEIGLNRWTIAVSTGESSIPDGRAVSPTRSTPDGRILIFQSHARLVSGYDNKSYGEIYRYDTTAPEGERIVCVSCDPSGAPPTTDALLQVEPADLSYPVINVTDDGGMVLFESFDRLLPEDANSEADVYEWEVPGVDGCKRVNGCLALISSGQGEQPSYLYAMTADAHDVFVITPEKLVSQDVAGSASIYDARVGGGLPEPTSALPCQGDACQGNGSEPPLLLSPATVGSGDGNATPRPPKPCRKGKHRVKGRCVRKHAHKHKRDGARRGRRHPAGPKGRTRP
jgi:hypothetical protein